MTLIGIVGGGTDVGGVRLERWYRQMERALAVGMDLPGVLEQCGGAPARDRKAMAAALRAGTPVDEVLAGAPRWLPQTDRLLLSSGAASGRLSEVCGTLAEEHADLAKNRSALILAALYPIVVLQGALLLLPAVWAVDITENGSPHFDLVRFGEILAALNLGGWGAVLGSGFVAKLMPRMRERVLRLVPGVGAYWRHRTLARFAATLDGLLEAGARYAEAVGGAALSVNDTRLTPAVLGILPRIDAGQSLGEIMPDLSLFPESFRDRFITGEMTGQLHHVLPELATEHRQAAKRALFHVAFWYPKLLFLAAAVAVGASVALLYKKYLDFVLQLAE